MASVNNKWVSVIFCKSKNVCCGSLSPEIILMIKQLYMNNFLSYRTSRLITLERHRSVRILARLRQGRLSQSPFVVCVVYGYCMTFGETASPGKRTVCTPLSPECLWYNELLYVSSLHRLGADLQTRR